MASGNIKIELDEETRAVIESLTDQVKALRDLLETKAGTEVHNHYHYSYSQPSIPYQVSYSNPTYTAYSV